MGTLTLDYAQPTAQLQRTTGVAFHRPVRVLHIVPSIASGGMERSLLRLVERSMQHERQVPGGLGLVHGICVLDRVMDDFIPHCPRDVRIWELGRQRPGRWRHWRKLRDVVKQFEPDVVHARSTGAWFDATVAVIGRPRVRLLLSFHGRTSLDPVGWRRQLIHRWATGRASAVLTVSEESARALQGMLDLPADKLFTIHNGVDTCRFAPAENECEVLETRRRLQLHPSADVAVCVANLLPIKGLDVLVRSWRQVHMADPLAALLVVGEGPLRQQLEQQCRESRCEKFIRFLGPREDVDALLRAADAFVLPSWYEGCSNAALEAMASGLPVIASDVGGMRELVTHNRSGWLIPPGRSEELSRTLLTVLLDRALRNRAGAAGRDLAVKHFGVDTWVARHASLYRQLAGLAPLRQPREATPCVE